MIRPPDSRKFASVHEEPLPTRMSGEQSVRGNQPPGTPWAEQAQAEQSPVDDLPESPVEEPTDGDGSTTDGHEGAARTDTRITLPGATGTWVAREPASPDPDTPPKELPPFRPWNPALEKQRFLSPRTVTLILLACLAVGALGIYSRSGSSNQTEIAGRRNRFRAEVIPLTAADQDSLDAAFAARKAGKFAEASQLFTALGSKHPNWGSMDIEIARTQLDQQDSTAGQALLKAAADRGLASADAHFNLGLLFAMQKDYRQAEANFADATALDPTRADFYYFWGECLRNEGKPLEATGKFRSALLRNQYETTEGLYILKLWLSELEADRGNAERTNSQIEALLAQPRPPMEVLFLAAARDLKAGDFKTGADWILRARQFVEPRVFRVVLGDPVFAQESWRPELAEIFRSVSPPSNLKTEHAPSVSSAPAAEGKGGATPAAQSSVTPAKSE